MITVLPAWGVAVAGGTLVTGTWTVTGTVTSTGGTVTGTCTVTSCTMVTGVGGAQATKSTIAIRRLNEVFPARLRNMAFPPL
jgi:hypothetical protein